MRSCFFYRTEIGRIGIEEYDGKICHIYFEEDEVDDLIDVSETVMIRNAYIQIDEYLKGKRKSFDLPLQLEGTDFELDVYRALLTVPYSKTISYDDLASKIACRNKAVQVEKACMRNPLAIIIPCHRVLGKKGELSTYRGKLEIKRYLLNLERDSERIVR